MGTYIKEGVIECNRLEKKSFKSKNISNYFAGAFKKKWFIKVLFSQTLDTFWEGRAPVK